MGGSSRNVQNSISSGLQPDIYNKRYSSIPTKGTIHDPTENRGVDPAAARPECGVRLEFDKNHGCIHVHAHVHVHVYVCMCMYGVRGGEHT